MLFPALSQLVLALPGRRVYNERTKKSPAGRQGGGAAVIAAVEPSKIREAARVHSISWQDSHKAFCSADFVAAHTPERQEDYLRRKIAAGSRLFMLTDGEPVGVVSVTGSLIEDLYVLPVFRNRGYGSALLRFAVAACEGTPTLWILENNRGAERLYRRSGFRETGRRHAIADGLDEIEFELR